MYGNKQHTKLTMQRININLLHKKRVQFIKWNERKTDNLTTVRKAEKGKTVIINNFKV